MMLFLSKLNTQNPLHPLSRPGLAAVMLVVLTLANKVWAIPEFPDVPLVRRPNVILFVIDDLGYNDLDCYCETFYETPCIDQLATHGIRMRQFYSAHPVCSPTRASLMTGKAPQRLGITQWIPQPSEKHLPLEEVTIAEALLEAGYKTGYIGKWHLGEKDAQMPDRQGFQWIRCVNRAGQPASYFHPFQRTAAGAGKYWDVPDLSHTKPGDYLTDKLTDFAIEFVNQNKNEPFFLCFAHYAVHTPIESPSALVEKYQRKKKNERVDEPSANFAERNGAISRARNDDPVYAAMVENLDANVGRVIDHLTTLSLIENTIVILTSDNGGLSTLSNRAGPTSCRPLRAGKGWNYEGGIRVPTIVSWPGELKPKVVDQPGITMDLFPTILELAGLPLRPKQHLDGVSLADSLRNPEHKPPDRTLGWHYPHNHGSGHRPSSAIREGDWKLIHHISTDEYELYNLASDISEQNNLASSQPEIVGRLKVQIESMVKSKLATPQPPRVSGSRCFRFDRSQNAERLAGISNVEHCVRILNVELVHSRSILASPMPTLLNISISTAGACGWALNNPQGTATRGINDHYFFPPSSLFAPSLISPQSEMVTGLTVLPVLDPWDSIALTTSIPFNTRPNTTCLPSSHGVLTVVMKNCEPLVLGPALAMLNNPGSYVSN